MITQLEKLVTKRWSKIKNSQNFNNHNKSRERSKSRKDIKYFYCGKLGYMKKECRKYKRKQSRERDEEKKEEKDTAAVVSDVDVTLIYDDDTINLICHDCIWIVDSDTSFHVTSGYDFFTSYTSSDFGSVRMKNDGITKIMGMGDVCLKISIECSEKEQMVKEVEVCQ